MSQDPRWLLEHTRDTYSQSGEDGVLAKMLMLLDRSQWCVEFGAWDGIHLSNVRRLIQEESYRAILIEGDRQKYELLKRNYADNKNVQPVHAFVGYQAGDSLDKILASYSIPSDFDVLSIDIDGNDYYVWEAFNRYRPKIVCIEFNPTIPTEVDFRQIADARTNQGSSLMALDQLGRSKGYELVCVLPFNAVFVDKTYFPRFDIADNRPQVMRKDHSAITWLFSGYDGTVHLAGAKNLPWHGLSLEEQRMQVLPRLLRSYPDSYTPFQKLLFRAMAKLRLLR
jgi:hypothetical protein